MKHDNYGRQALPVAILLFFLFMSNVFAKADGVHTRGIGVYPGRSADYKGPDLVRTNEYRNLALRRKAIASSSVDYNLTAQLATDGVEWRGEPTTLRVTLGGDNAFEPTLRDKEKTIDGNIHSQNTLMGENAFIQYDWTGMSVRPEALRLLAEVVYHPDKAVGGYCIKVLASSDGRKWREIGREEKGSLPGNATKQTESSDPNKQEAAIMLPLRLLLTSIPLSFTDEAKGAWGKSGISHLRIEFSMKGCAYWRLYEVDQDEVGDSRDFSSRQFVRWTSRNAGWLPSAHFTSAWVADSRVDANPWLSVDLGAEADISQVKFSWIHEPKQVEVQVSDDGKSWRNTTLARKASPCSGRYVRVVMSHPDKSGLFALSEMEVWGRGGLTPVVASADEGITEWQLCRDGDDLWIPATVPATVLTSYINIGAVPDNVVGDNMRQISESFFNSDFWYRANIKVKHVDRSRHTYLCLDGINWKAELWINGTPVGRIDGAFKRGRFDVTDVLRKGDNELRIKIVKNAHFGAVKVKNAESTDLNGGILGADNPTFHASIGWDWITSVPGRELGIWNDVYLSADRGVSVSDPLVTTKLSDGGKLATMTPAVFVKNNDNRERTVTVRGWIGDIVFDRQVTLGALEECEVVFRPEEFAQLRNREMRLWWPNGYGEPYLYDAGFCVVGDEESGVGYKAGIREMAYTTLGTQAQIFINGKRLVPLGGNWGFSEINLNYRGREYDAAVRYHKEMNFNMIRNWVGQVGEEEFYEACDKYGIMVWQDFWLANPWDGPDPDDEPMFLANSADLIRKVRRHPGIGIYVGRNEGFPPETIDKALRRQLQRLHPQLGYIPSSADEGVSGHGPYRMMPTRYYFENQTRKLHSERGMPNVPTYESLRRMLEATDGKLPSLAFDGRGSDAWGQHDFTMAGAQHGASFLEIMEKHFGKPVDDRQFAAWAQWLNYDGYRAMYEGSQQYRQGLLIWMSHSCWPSMAWCTYDYYLEPTGAYFGAKKACEPLHVQFNEATRGVEVVNIAAGRHDGLELTVEVLDIHGKTIGRQQAKVSVGDDQTVRVLDVPEPDADVYYLRLRLLDGGKVVSENFYVEGREADRLGALATLSKAGVDAEVGFRREGDAHIGQVVLRNRGDVPALLVRLNLKGTDGEQILPVIYSDNYFHLMPGEEKTVDVSYLDEDGRGCEPTVEVLGFNL